jgi:hypothetical protein
VFRKCVVQRKSRRCEGSVPHLKGPKRLKASLFQNSTSENLGGAVFKSTKVSSIMK